jgi:PIN domain nuclease of toxin-antitoxin system
VKVLLDSSAALAVLLSETGKDVVEPLVPSAAMSAVNL